MNKRIICRALRTGAWRGGGSGGDGGGGGGGQVEVEGGGMRDIGQQTDPTIGEYVMSVVLHGIVIATAAAPFISTIMSALKRETSQENA